MHVLSLDYHTNIPSSGKISQGGPARFSKRLSTYLQKQGHSWTGIVALAQEGAIVTTTKLFAQENITYYQLLYDAASKNSLTTLQGFSKPEVKFRAEIESLKNILAQEKPTVIFLNGFSLVSWMLLRAGFESGIPVATQHAGFFKNEIRQYSEHFSKNARRMLYQMERDITAMSAAEIFLNTWSEKVYNKTVQKVPKKKSVVIPLPYDEVKMEKKSPQFKNGDIHIGMVARWDRIKNHEAIYAVALKAIQKKLPWKFFAVTVIPQSTVKAQFKKDYQKLVTVLPPKSPEELRKFYNDMDVLLLPSHFDVSPHVVMEAAIEGVGTIISHNVGWGDEYRECGMGEWIMDFSSPKKVCDAIQTLVVKKRTQSSNRDVVMQLRKHILQTHNPSTVLAQYQTLFINIASAK